MVDETGRNPLLMALLDWIDGYVLVLNPQRQIVLASPDLLRLLAIEDTVEIIGCRPGEALGCIHAAEGRGGCGTSSACRYCGALGAILESMSADEPIESECKITVRGEGGEQTKRYHLRASHARSGTWDFTVFVLRPAGAEWIAPAASAEDAEAPDWPSDLADYVRVRALGVGGMGTVFLVRTRDDREVALKTIRCKFAADEEVADRFLREIRIALVLDHPNIIRTHRADQTDGGSLYMVSEYCPSGTLYHWLQTRGPVPVDLALFWMHGVALALEYSWREHRIVHRDIKPDNILLDDDHRAKIADFGLARRTARRDPRLTAAPMVMGTAHYMAPEQAVGAEELDVRADLYALGATFFELLTGQPPIDGPTPTVIMARKMTLDAPSLERQRKDIPHPLSRCVDWLLARDRDQRPADPGQLLAHLDELIRTEGIDLFNLTAKYSARR